MTALQELQALDQQRSKVSQQKTQYKHQVLEIDNALQELETVNEGYQIVGGVMIKKSSKNIISNLQQKKEIASLRLKTLEKQEEELTKQVQKLQQQVITELDKE